MATTGLSGHEIYCLDKIGLKSGDILVGNSVHSMGVMGSLGSGFRSVVGGEVSQITQLIEEGRQTAYSRMEQEALQREGFGITGVSSELVFHEGNIEFLSIGSAVHMKDVAGDGKFNFSTSSDGQELFTQVDAGYQPLRFVFGNVAYSIGITKGLLGSIKTLRRGEIKEFSGIFNTTRNLALQRIIDDAKKVGANSIVGIETSILPVGISGVQEMLMIGTASYNKKLAEQNIDMVTSDLTCQEMWNMTKMGYAPVRLVLGTSVYSLGFVGGVTSFVKSFVKGEIPELSRMIYDAREESLAIIKREADELGCEDVVGVKTYVYQLGSGLIEFLAIGTAVKKIAGVATQSEELIPQAIITDHDTFVNAAERSIGVNLNRSGV